MLVMLRLLFLIIPLQMMAHDAVVYFASEERLERRLIELIRQEEKSIFVCVYAFTHRGIASALTEARKRGVDVEVVVDRFSVKAQSPLQRIVNAGIPVYVWDPVRPKKVRRPIMHHKFCVLDRVKYGLDRLILPMKLHAFIKKMLLFYKMLR